MEKRVLVAMALCVGMLTCGRSCSPPPEPPAGPGGAAPSEPPPVRHGAGRRAPAAPRRSARRKEPGRRSRQSPGAPARAVTPEVRFVFSSLGGTLLHAKPLEKSSSTTRTIPASGHDVVRTKDAANAPLRDRLSASGFPTPADGAWEASQPTPDTVVFAADIGPVHIEKRYRARQGPLSPALGRRAVAIAGDPPVVEQPGRSP